MVNMDINPNNIPGDNEGHSPESKIMNAARLVFMEKGYDGARMQQIAEKAGMNKALLHYYFGSKDKLFLAVFEAEMTKLLSSLLAVFFSDKPFSDKIRDFFEMHFGFLLENPMIPRFIVTEMTRHPDKLDVFFRYFRDMGIYKKFENLINESIKKGEIKEIQAIQLMLNLLSLSIFPVLASPMLQGVMDIPEEEYNKILVERKELVAEFVIDSIIVK